MSYSFRTGYDKRLEEMSKRLDAAAMAIAQLIGRQIAVERLNQKSADEH